MGKPSLFRSAVRIALVVGVLAPPALLLIVDTAPPASASPDPDWWNENYQYRKKITINAGATTVPEGYSCYFEEDTATLIADGKLRSDGKDWRVLYWNGASWVELDRYTENWNSATTETWFKLQAQISGGGSDDNYYVYYGYADETGDPPTDKNKIFFSEVCPTVNTLNATRQSYQRHVFFLDGYFYVFYGDGTNYVYRTSSDGVNWSSPITIRADDAQVWRMSLFWDGTYIQYVYGRQAPPTSPLYYRRGTVSGQTITWDDEVAIDNTENYRHGTGGVTKLGDGYPYVAYTDAYQSGGSGNQMFLVKATAENGTTWGTPQSPGYFAGAYPTIISRGGSNFFWVCGYGANLRGDDVVSFGSWETIDNTLAANAAFSVLSIGADVHVVWLSKPMMDTTYYIKYCKRSDSTWNPTVTLADNVDSNSNPVMAKDENGNLYVFWFENDKLYLKKFDNSSSQWLTKKFRAAVDNPNENTLTCSVEAQDNKIALVWAEGASSPYSIKFRGMVIPEPTSSVGTVEAPAAWQLIETWTGVVNAPAAWQVVETWTSTVSAPAAWQIMETWTGTVQAPAEWQVIESWTGTVNAPAQWQLIETWTGTVQAPAEWQLIESWTGTVQVSVPGLPTKPVLYLPLNGSTISDNTPYFEWTKGENADNHRLLVDNDADFSSPEDNVLLGATDSTWTKSAPGYPGNENYSWKVVAINPVGENESETWTFQVDTSAPGAPVSLAASPSGWTSTNSFTVSWINPSDLSGIAGAYYKLDSAPTSPTDGTYVVGAGLTSIFGISVPGDGSHSVYVWLKDRAGNVDHTNRNSTTIHLDTTAPRITLSPTLATKMTVTGSRIEVSGTVSDLTSVTIKVNGVAVSAAGGSFSHTVSLSVGLNTITITAVDAVGNASSISLSIIRTEAGAPAPPSAFPTEQVAVMVIVGASLGIAFFVIVLIKRRYRFGVADWKRSDHDLSFKESIT